MLEKYGCKKFFLKLGNIHFPFIHVYFIVILRRLQMQRSGFSCLWLDGSHAHRCTVLLFEQIRKKTRFNYLSVDRLLFVITTKKIRGMCSCLPLLWGGSLTITPLTVSARMLFPAFNHLFSFGLSDCPLLQQ